MSKINAYTAYVTALCIWIAFGPLPACAQSNAEPIRDWTVYSQNVTAQQDVVNALSERERQILDEIDRTGFELDAAKRALDKILAESKNVENDLLLLSQHIETLEMQALNSANLALAGLVNLYKTRMLGDIGTLASSDSLLDLSLRQKLLQNKMQNDLDETLFLKSDLVKLRAAQMEMSDLQAFQAKKITEYQNKLLEIKNIRAQNQTLLKNISVEKDLQIAALKYLEASSQRLDAQIWELNQSALRMREPNEKNIQIGSFSTSKGLLIMPVKGKIITKFGPYKPQEQTIELFRKGVDIRANPEASVNAVFTGTVVFADWFKGYGNMLILEHNDGYYTIYARLGKMYKEKAQVVLGGEVIGEINNDNGLSGSDLYFEIRHHAQPLDPAVWLTKNR